MAEYFGLKIGIDGEKDFRMQLNEIKLSLKGLGTELVLCGSQFDKQDKSMQAFTARNESLSKAIDTQKDLITALEKGLENSVAAHGEHAGITKKWAIELNNAKTTLNEMERELANNNRALGDGNAQYEANQRIVKDCTSRNEELSKQIENQKTWIDSLRTGLADASEKYGENDVKTQRWKDTLFVAENALTEMTAEFESNNGQIKKHNITIAEAVQKEQEYKSSVDGVNQNMRVLDSEMKKVDAQYGKNSKSLDALSEKNKILNLTVAEQKDKVTILREALEKSAVAFGTADSRTKEWAIQLNNAEATLNEMERELQTNSRELLTNGEYIYNLTKKKKELTGEIKTQKSEIESLRTKLLASKIAYGENSDETKKWASKLDDAETELEQLGRELSDTNVELQNSKTAFKEMRGGLNDFAESADDAGKRSLSLGDIIKGNLISSAVISGFKALGAAIKSAFSNLKDEFTNVVNKGMEFESSFANVRKTIEATDEEFTRISASLREMSTEIPVSAAELANLGGVAGQLGIQKENLSEFARVIADIGVATNLAGEEGAAQLAKFANITQMSQSDFRNLGSSIVALGNNFATTEQDIMRMAMRLAGAGSTVGMSQADILGLATALSSVGIEAEMGGSAISKVMVRMSAAASTSDKFAGILNQADMSLRDMQLLAANNSKGFKDLAYDLGFTSTELNNLLKNAVDLENFSEVAGMTGAEFKKAFGDDAMNALQLFMNGLSDTEGKGQTTIEMLQEMGLTEVRLRDSLLRAAQANDLFSDAVLLSNEAWGANSALTKEAAERYNTLENKIQTFRNNVDDFRIEVFEGIQDTLKEIVDLGTGYVNQLSTAFKEGGVDALLDEAGNVIADIVIRMSQALPQFISVVSDIMLKIAGTVSQNAPVIISQLVSAVSKLAPSVAEIGAILIIGIIKGIISSLPQIIAAAFDIVKGLADGIGKALPVIKPFTFVISEIMDGMKTLAPFIAAAALAVGTFTACLNAAKIAAVVYGAAVKALTAIKAAVTAAQIAWNLAMLANPIGLIIAGVAALAVGVAALIIWLNKESDVSKKLSEQTEKLVEANDKLVESLDASKQSYSDKTSEIEKNAAASKTLADKINDLSKVENKSAEQKQELAAYVGMLNEAMGETVITYDAESDALSQNMSAIYGRIDALQAEAKAQAARERAVEIAKEQIVVEEQLNALNKQSYDLVHAFMNDDITKKRYEEQMGQLNASIDTLTVTQGDLATAFDYTTNTIIESSAAAQKYADDSEEAFERAAVAAEETAAVQQKVLEGLSEEYTKLKDATTDMFSALSDEVTLTVGDMQSNLETNQRVVSEWADNIVTLANRGIDDGLLEVLREAGPSSAGHVKALVTSSDIELQKLSETFAAGGEVAVQALAAELGVDVSIAQAAADMVGGASESLNAAIEEADFSGMGENIASGFSQGIGENTYLAEDAAGALGDAVSESARGAMGIHSPSTVFTEIGENVVDGLVKGIEDKAAKAQEAMENLMLLLSKNAVDTITKDVKVSGEGMVDSIADGVSGNNRLFTVTEKLIADAKSTAQTAVDRGGFPSIGNTVVDNVYQGILEKETWFKRSVYAFFSDIGTELMSGLKNGIDGALKSVLDTVAAVGNKAVDECKSVLASNVFRNIGNNLMEGLGSGISGGEAGVKSTLTAVGKRLVSEFKSLLEIKSPSKVFAKIGGHLTDGLSDGIENGEKDVTAAIGGLADSVINNIDGISPEKNVLGNWTAMFESLKRELKSIFSLTRDDSVLKQYNELGKNIAMHIGQGFSDEMRKVVSDMQNAMPSNFSANIGTDTAIGSVNRTGINSSPLVTVQQMVVRSEDDIRRVSQGLYNLIDGTSRAYGYAAVSP